ncbi:MAG TPA: hypothetical protein VK141_03975 [Nitrosomonas sp.]|nr:hypothetical protein [Nitrosomonas sp.]
MSKETKHYQYFTKIQDDFNDDRIDQKVRVRQAIIGKADLFLTLN